MADDLPVELKVRNLSLKPSTDVDEQTLPYTQGAAVRSCAFAAVQEGLAEESVVIKFRRQVRESRLERYRQGIRFFGCNCSRTTELPKPAYGAAEQALWVAAQEDKMVEQYSLIVRLAGVRNTEESVQEMPNAGESVVEKPSIEESVQERPCAEDFVSNEHGDHVAGDSFSEHFKSALDALEGNAQSANEGAGAREGVVRPRHEGDGAPTVRGKKKRRKKNIKRSVSRACVSTRECPGRRTQGLCAPWECVLMCVHVHVLLWVCG